VPQTLSPRAVPTLSPPPSESASSSPFFFRRKVEAVTAAAVISLVAHFAVGAAKSIISIRSWQFSGLEVTIVGALEGAVTNGIGILLGKGSI